MILFLCQVKNVELLTTPRSKLEILVSCYVPWCLCGWDCFYNLANTWAGHPAPPLIKALFCDPYMLNVDYGDMGTNVGYFEFGITVLVIVLTYLLVLERARLSLEKVHDFS